MEDLACRPCTHQINSLLCFNRQDVLRFDRFFKAPLHMTPDTGYAKMGEKEVRECWWLTHQGQDVHSMLTQARQAPARTSWPVHRPMRRQTPAPPERCA